MTYYKQIIYVLLFIGAVNRSYSQSLFSYEKYVNSEGKQLLYRQLIPDYNEQRRYPLVIFLHGSGERGDDNEAQLKWGVKNFSSDENMKLHPAIVIVPQCPEEMSWSNFSDWENDITLKPDPSEPMKLVLELLEQVKNTLPVDTTRIYITGISLGGYGTFDAIARRPDLFAAAVPVCGGGDLSKAPDTAHIPMWIFSGAEDSAVSPQLSLDMANSIMEAGGKPGYTQYPEVGHFSWIAAYNDPMMMAWLFRQQKKAQ